ncbi:hormogonium polysaccharide biosynthesis glycosyltransferase HpsE [Pseudanabaena sp. FACHB-2040]|uniref:hormogonium polysaccharide biosynthesis glycosyltransferase HpsE n=1 Tax=Pseudanabaena sp. FACHB-2040 TaxID=2692859 RepID=UPI001687BD2C|nr:hormogonium polysaccharide biosynthesis glycosyltransferase HpsE [Pseudanabaena sp. FACHB-2040]MBD2256763.1 glycosyltransferase [Pseudanabaena sp. FACHB-2040]
MPPDFTVVIPTYNRAAYLPPLLERLQTQQGVESLRWEVVVVDNNSTDSTADLIKQIQSTWSAPCPLRYCFEPQQGSAYARQRGIEEAASPLVGCLDDDNLPEPTWVVAAVAFAEAHPNAGAFASRIYGQYEAPPPEALRSILFYLALNDRGDQPLRYEPRRNGMPPSAGLVVRREAWLQCVPSNLLLIGRVGQSMLAGEDYEALLHLHRAGWQVWYNPAMEIQHCIPPSRLTFDYMSRNLWGIGLGRHHLRMLALPTWQRPAMLLAYLLSDLKKAGTYYWQHRQDLGSQGAAACEMRRLVATVLSPFFVAGLGVQRQIEQVQRNWAGKQPDMLAGDSRSPE